MAKTKKKQTHQEGVVLRMCCLCWRAPLLRNPFLFAGTSFSQTFVMARTLTTLSALLLAVGGAYGNPPIPDSTKIEHFVVLYMENRPFVRADYPRSTHWSRRQTVCVCVVCVCLGRGCSSDMALHVCAGGSRDPAPARTRHTTT